MLNYIYQLTSPKNISIKYEQVDVNQQVIVRPEYLAICHADQRYYQGNRDAKILRKKLPMALIHEGCGRVLYDPTHTFQIGEKVIMIPNILSHEREDALYENYRSNGGFLSSGLDGFMREFVNINPDRLVRYNGIDGKIAAITEFVSVGMHGVARFSKLAHNYRERIGVWGDGSLSFIVCNILKYKFPQSKICVIGKNINKLNQFSFVDEVYLADDLSDGFQVDHAFECAGGEGSAYAIDDIIRYINPQGVVALMGVSENRVPVNTRDVLEKGLIFVGCSRSGREDFCEAVEFMKNKRIQNRLNTIIYETESVKGLLDIHKAFSVDLNTDFKTVFKWEV